MKPMQPSRRKRLLALSALALLLPACRTLTGGGGTDAAFEAFLAACFEEEVARVPERATSLGRPEGRDRWSSPSAEEARATVAMQQRFLAKLGRFDPAELSEENQLNHRLFAYELERAIEQHRWRRHAYPVTQMRGLHTGVPSLLMNMHTVESEQDLADYVARLEGVRPLFDELGVEILAREELGVLPPAFVFPLVLGACRNVVSGRPFEDGPDDSALFADYRAKLEALDLDDERASEWLRRGEDALRESVQPAYEHLIALLTEQAARADERDGAWKLPQGAEYYAHRLRLMTTTGMDAATIHATGLSEVERIHREMRAIQESVGFEGSLQDFFEHLRTDERYYYANDDAGRARYLSEAAAIVDAMKARLPEVFGTLPKADMIVKAVEPYRSASAGKAFYSAGAPDGSRPGIYYANLHDMADMPIYQMEALAFHEGIPGHHMQNSIARELEGLPSFRKFGGYTAYGEGWALYTEYFPKEMGFYEDPYSDFGRLAMELWRACRLVVDTGLHELRWTRQEAIDYLLENTPNPEGDCRKAIERYIVMPGQATAYKVGMLEILALRERAKRALGERFDLRGFHDTLLTNGPVPLEVLGELVDAWIAEQET